MKTTDSLPRMNTDKHGCSIQCIRVHPCSSVVKRIVVCLGLLSAWQGSSAAERTTALPPDEALKSFQLEPGLRIELVAAEPLVVDPVAFAFDDQQRLYVVENRGYPG